MSMVMAMVVVPKQVMVMTVQHSSRNISTNCDILKVPGNPMSIFIVVGREILPLNRAHSLYCRGTNRVGLGFVCKPEGRGQNDEKRKNKLHNKYS